MQLNHPKLEKELNHSFFSKFNFLIILIFSFTTVKAQFCIKGTLFISSTSTVACLESSFILEPNAAFTNNGTIQNKSVTSVLGNTAPLGGSGSLVFSGTAAQTIDGNNYSIDCNVTINNSNNLAIATSALGSAPVTSNDLNLLGVLTFTSGDIVTGDNRVVFKAGSSYTGAADANHINGWCKKIGNTSFVFPVGTGAKLRSTGISAPSSASDAFECKYYYTNPNPTYDVTLKDATLNNVSLCEYWMLNRTVGSSSATVTLSWDNVYSCGVTAPADLRVARWDGAKWADHGNATWTGNATEGTLNSSAAITSFSPFALASVGTANPLPVELIAFDAICEDGNVNMYWSTASEHNNADFTIERSIDGVNWENIVTTPGAGNSTQLLNYNWMDSEPIRGTRYYQLKQTDFDGIFTYSDMVYIQDCTTAENSLTILPNPASEYIQLSLNYGEILNFQVFDSRGQIVAEKSFEEQTAFYDLAISTFQPGVYFVHVSTNSGSLIEKFVKIL